MLTIRKDQMEALAQAAQQRFCKEMMPHLRRVFSTHLARVPDSDLLAVIGVRVDQATRSGLSERRDVRRYLEVSIVESWPADGPSPTARWILNRTDLTPRERMDHIERGSIPEQTADLGR